MFTNIFFIILLMLLIAFVPEVDSQSTMAELTAGSVGFCSLIALIFFQNRLNKSFTRRHLSKMLVLTNIEILTYICLFYFVLNAHSLFLNSGTILSIVSFAIYFLGLGVHHMATYKFQSHSLREEYRTPLSYATMQINFLIPFVIPFTLLSLVFDSTFLIKNEIVLLAISVASIFLLLILFPVALQSFWGCRPIEDKILRDRLENFCKKLRFKNAGILTWSVMKHALTAAIIGIVPRFRYVMFTDRILRELPPESLEAILAHEIAHSKRGHLIFYPFILLGISAAGALVFLAIGDSVTSPIFAFFIYAATALIYMRIVFGYFSRIFERQADLYVFEAGVPHHHMLYALDYIGTASGNTHLIPNWHHYGIQERIDFLSQAAIDRTLIKKHNRKVKWSIIAYFILLTITFIILIGA
jgi:Zn-dependent protease with chaperone function